MFVLFGQGSRLATLGQHACRAALLMLAVLVGEQAGRGEDRSWTTTKTGETFDAEFLDLKGQKVQLRKTDGTEVALPIASLSKEDRDYVRAEMQSRKKAATKTGTGKSAAGKTASGKTAAKTLTVATAGEWPRWRGVNFDNKSPETGLLKSWPAAGPPLLWQVEGLGTGFASVAVAGGKIFTMGRLSGVDSILVLDEGDGHVLVTAPVGPGKRERGPNCTPTVDGNLMYGLSIDGDLVCAEVATGKQVWRKSYAGDFGGRMMSGWGYSESPLVDGDRLICTPGGEQAIMAALDKRTGNVIWKTPLPAGGERGKDGAGYSSIVISEGAGVKQYVQLVGRGVIGVAADSGKLLWGYNKVANDTANIPTPIVSGDYVFCSTGYGAGAALLKLSGSRGQVEAKEVYFKPGNEVQNHHGGMVLVDGYVYMGNKHNEGFPLCLNMLTGEKAWDPGRGAGRGSAAVAYADGMLYFRYQDGTMALIEANPKQYHLVSSFKLPSVRAESWPQPVIAGGRLWLRDQEALMCYDLRAASGGGK
jgi:outer membrane protein assembly factor BamB